MTRATDPTGGETDAVRGTLRAAAATDLTMAEAGEMLGVTERTFRRWSGRYQAEGAEGCRIGGSAGSRPVRYRSMRRSAW